MLLFLSCKTFLFGQSTDLLFSSDPGADDLTDPYAQYQITLIEGEKKAMVGTYEFAIGSGTTKYYMQIYDLSQIALDQIYSGVNSMNDKDLGAFSPNSYSPRFRGLTFTTAITDYESLWGENVLAMMNSAFLEDADVIPLGKYNHTTSFPVKVNGNLVTGGSSLFGPGSVNCPGNFCGTLRALVWNNGTSSADIVDYNHTSGSPLSSWENAIVSYIFEAISPLDETIDVVREEIRLIGEYRTRLITDVVTGKVDVRGVAFEMSEEFDESDLPEIDEDELFEEDEALEEMLDGED